MLDEMFQLIVSKFATLIEDEIVLISIFLKHFLHKNLKIEIVIIIEFINSFLRNLIPFIKEIKKNYVLRTALS